MLGSLGATLPLFESFLNEETQEHSYWAQTFLKSSLPGEFLGDPHLELSKVLVDKIFYFKDILRLGDFWRGILGLIPEFIEFFPTYKDEKSGITSRNYVPVFSRSIEPLKYYYNFGLMSALCVYLKMIDLNPENLLIKDATPPPIYLIQNLVLLQNLINEITV